MATNLASLGHCDSGEFRGITCNTWAKPEGVVMKFLKPCVFLGLLAILAIWISSLRAETLIPDVPHPYAADLLTHIRAAAKAIPGPLPIRINFIKIAESHRPLSDIIVGGSQQDYVSAR